MGGSGKDAVYSDLHKHITNKKVEKLRHVMIIMKLKQRRK